MTGNENMGHDDMNISVTVIVPVYKVEPYLKRCLDSLYRQSLSGVEFILIDDASPDRCGDICERYATIDKRFKVFHHAENKGLSAARNLGIRNASGDYLMFVDSDDWVHDDFCRDAYECAERYQADLVIFNHIKVRGLNPEKEETKVLKGFKEGYKTTQEALDIILENEGNAAWNKIYRKSLFDDISYPEGFVYEDTGTTYKLVCKSSCTYFLDHALYYYCVRPDSITTFVSPKVLNDRARLNSQRYRDLGTWGYHSEILDYRIKHFALWYLIRKKRDFSDANYTFLYRTLRCGFHVPKRFSKKQTAQWLLFRLSPLLFDLYYTLKGKKI